MSSQRRVRLAMSLKTRRAHDIGNGLLTAVVLGIGNEGLVIVRLERVSGT